MFNQFWEQKHCLIDVLFLIAKEIIKMNLKSICFLFRKIKTLSDIRTKAIKRMDFIPTKFRKVSIFLVLKSMLNLIETLMV